MASKQAYECFVCKNNGFPAVMVYLAGKDSEGKAVRQEANGSPHQHKSKVPSQQQQQQQQSQQTKQQGQEQQQYQSEYDQSVDRGISAFSMMSSLIVLVEQNQKVLVALNDKVDRLLNLAERK